MRQNYWPHPLFAVVVSRVIDPHRPDWRVERALPAPRKQPDPSISIAHDTSKVIISVGAPSLRFLPCPPGGHFRFGTVDRQICRSSACARARQSVDKRTDRFHPLPVVHDAQADLPIAIEPDSFVTDQPAPIFSPSWSTEFVTNPQPPIV